MSKHIKDIQDSGQFIILDDSSNWKVSLFDSVNTKNWGKGDEVEISPGKMTNLSRNNESVEVIRKV